MFPLKDENPTEITPYVTFIIIGLNVFVWLFVQGAGVGDRFIASLCTFGAIPGEITGTLPLGSAIEAGGLYCEAGGLVGGALFSSMFMHGSWMHLIGNMWFMWVFGNNIEDSMGHGRFIVFYLLTGLLAAGSHVLLAPDSAVPMVGASGAISGVMGAYIVLYPRVKVKTLIILVVIIRVFDLPAMALLGLWIGIQVVQGVMAGSADGGGVAFAAHVGGFIAGVALIKVFVSPKLVQAKREHRQLTRQELPPWERW